MDDKTQHINTYNQQAKPLSEKFATIGSRLKHIKEAFSYINKPNPNVLEIGCGDGRDAAEIIKLTNNYLGIDISKSMIELAKKAVPQAKFQVNDFETMKFEKGLDIIFAFAALLHTDPKNFKNILDKIYESLNPGGIFYISVKHGDNKRKVVQDDYGKRIFYFYMI